MSFKLRVPTFGEVVRHLFLAWLTATLLEYLLVGHALCSLETMDAIDSMSFPRLLLVMVAGATMLWLCSCFFQFSQYERYLIAGVFFALTLTASIKNRRPAFLFICLIVLLILTFYCIRGHKASHTVPKPAQKSHWAFPAGLTALTVLLFAFLCAWTLCRYWTFSTPTYDFGIFSQMFHNMKATGLPITTVERESAMSHFAVHVSPIYYLMLPVYWLFPDPTTLQVLQVVIVLSAVIPLWLIGKHHGLSGILRLFICALFLFLPAVGGGIYYDLHENCFLLPLVLWLLYSIDRRKAVLIILFSCLTLTVKEDAAVYVAVAALYLTIRTALHYRRELRRDLFTGIFVLALSVFYFLLVTNYLATQGDGVMTYRYQNFMLKGDSSLFSVIIAVLLCPMKMLFECVDPEKQTYILQTLLPLLGLPLITRKYERYLLLIPYLLINLMSDYRYQHDIFFQYNFGSTAFLIYLTAVNLSDLRIAWTQLLSASTAAVIACAFFFSTVYPKASSAIQLHLQYENYYDQVRENLDMIPDGASVAAGTFYVAYLSDRTDLYDVKYCTTQQLLSAEYIAVNKGSATNFENYGGFENFSATVARAGFEIINNHQSVIIYHKTADKKP